MAKDGTNRGGRRPGAGRKKKPLSEKIKEGKSATVMKLPEPPELENISMPPIKDFMTAEQRMGELHADEIYGYNLVDGKYEVNPAEAEIVREIFSAFLEGQSMYRIATSLNERGVPTKRAGQVWKGKAVTGKWSNTVIRELLMNEAYLGIMILQKTTKDAAFNTIKNHGQLPMYRISEHHPSIIDPATFEAAQEKLKAGRRPQSQKLNHPFSQKLVCGRCGQHFNRYTNNVKNVYWRCRSRILDASSCQQPGILERKLEQLFVDVVAALKRDNSPIQNYLTALQQPWEKGIQEELATVSKRLAEIGAELSADRIAQRNQLLQRKFELEAEIDSMKSLEERQTEELLQIIRSDSSVAFSGPLFLRVIDHVTMEEAITFHFIGGLTITREVDWPHRGKRTDQLPL